MLLLKPDVVRVELLGLLPGDIVQRVLVDCPGAVELLAKLLKLGKLLEKVNGVGVEPELPDRGLVHLPCPLPLPELALELGIIHPSLHRRVAPNVSLVNPPGPVDLVIPQLHFDVGSPPLVVGLPLHPPLEDLASPRDVAQHLLHVDVLVPGFGSLGECPEVKITVAPGGRARPSAQSVRPKFACRTRPLLKDKQRTHPSLHFGCFVLRLAFGG